MTSASSFNYQVGGSLPADAPSYVERQCDRDYYELLKERKYCYVFNCRQMGKSSLRVRVTHKLQAEGIVCATIDPQKIGVEVTCEQWYASAIRSLVGDLDLKSKFDLRSWIRERELLSPVQRFAEFIETVVLQEIDAPIVIFVEEIDRLLSLKFGMDDFFGLVRSFFEDRPTKLDYNRLTFSFLGVATPTDLIQSHSTSAFNIGYAVEMAGFTLTEALPLMQGLASKVANSQDYLAEAVKWTGGQPFLIQRLLGIIRQELAGIASPENVALWVENLVQERIVTNWESQDAPPHLTTIRDRVLSVEEKLRGRMLGCYQQVLADGELEDDRSEERSKLRLTGLVVRRDGRLVSYNPIYGAVFNNVWVEGQLADLRPEFYGSAFREWQGAEQKDGFLLRGEALKNADEWARGKRLSDADEEFLRESREVERVESNLKFEAEQQAREIAEEKAIILGEAKLQADRRVLVGSGVLAVTLLLAAVAGGWATRFVNDANVKVADTRKDALAKSQKADEDVRSAKTEAEAIGKKADEIKKLAAKADAESKQNIKEALAKKEEADRNVEEAQKNLELAKAEAENVSQESAEKVTAAQAKIADAEIKVKEAINAQKEASAKFKDVSITLQKKESKLNQTEKNLLDTWTISQSEVLRQQGKNEDAVKILSQVIKVNPLNNFALLSRGNIFFQNKNYGESISDYKKALSIDDKYPITHFLIGYYFFSQKEYDEAIRSFEKAISLDPKYGYAYLYLGNALCGKEQYKAAVLAFRKAIEVSPDSICLVCALISLGNALVNQNKLDEAIDVYRQTINIEPKNAAAYNYLGNALFKKNEINQSILAIRKAIELDPKLANAYFSLGNLLISQSSFTEAATAYQQAISIDPTIPDIYNYLGVALGKQNKFDEAIDAIQKAIKIEPKNAVTYDNLGYILASQNEYNEAIIAFKQSIALNPKYIKAYKNLGRILIIQNKLDEADMIIHKAIEISPKDAELYNDLGTLLRMKNKFDESIFYFQQAIKIDPSLAIFHNNLCWIGILTGKKSRDFLSSCDKGVELTSGKENFDSRYIRGIARAIHGDINRSIEDFQFCLKWLEESDLKDSATARVITEQWIEELRAGKQPSEIFTQKVLAQMRND